MVDRFTRWPELAAVPNATAEAVVDAVIEKLVLRHGYPVQLLSDRGAQFTSRLFQQMSKHLGVQKIFTTSYHPQTNGQVERLKRFISQSLSAHVEKHQGDWDEQLEAITFAYSTSAVEAIGDTLFHSVHGRDPRLPTTVLYGSERQLDKDASEYGLEVTKKVRDAYDSESVRIWLITEGSEFIIHHITMCPS